MDRKRTLGEKETRISAGAMRGMATLADDKKVIATGKHIIGRVEYGGNLTTPGGLSLPDDVVPRRVFVESIGGDVKVDNQLGRALKEGDEVLVLSIAEIPVYNPYALHEKKLVVYSENDIIGIVENAEEGEK